MTNRLPVALAALALLALLPGVARAQVPDRARHSPCTGIYTGSARGVFWCKVVVVHDPKTLKSSLRVETEENIQMTGDAFQVVPGGFEWKGPPAVGLMKKGEANVTSAWSWLQTGQMPVTVDYVAARSAPKYPVDQGEVKLELSSVEPGPKTEAGQTYQVHGTFWAHLLPAPGAKAPGDILISITF